MMTPMEEQIAKLLPLTVWENTENVGCGIKTGYAMCVIAPIAVTTHEGTHPCGEYVCNLGVLFLHRTVVFDVRVRLDLLCLCVRS